MAKPKLLIVEDDEGLCSQYRWAFPACDVLLAHTRPQAVALVKKERPPVAIMDLGLPPDPDGVSEGFATLDEVLRIAPETKVIVVTGNGDRKNALKAVSRRRLRFLRKAGRNRGAAHDHRSRPEPAPARGGEPPPRGNARPLADRPHRHRAAWRC